MLKPVLFCGLVTLAAALRATSETAAVEGSGSGVSSSQLFDMEDLEDVRDEDGMLDAEGSGEDDEYADPLSPVVPAATKLPDIKKTTMTTRTKDKKKVVLDAAAPSQEPESQFEYDIHLSKLDDSGNEAGPLSPVATEKTTAKKTDELYEYYDDYYTGEYKDIKNYDSGDKDEDYNYTDTADFDRDSVLKIDGGKKEASGSNDIEIKPRPGSETEEAILETSQIFIMVGSAFVSFAIVMLTFFLCRRAMVKKREKKSQVAFTYIPEKRSVKEASIVKDYQKVPTSTRELLQNTRIDMYRGEEELPGASAPLVKSP
jgi:hypothetical protein